MRVYRIIPQQPDGYALMMNEAVIVEEPQVLADVEEIVDGLVGENDRVAYPTEELDSKTYLMRRRTIRERAARTQPGAAVEHGSPWRYRGENTMLVYGCCGSLDEGGLLLANPRDCPIPARRMIPLRTQAGKAIRRAGVLIRDSTYRFGFTVLRVPSLRFAGLALFQYTDFWYNEPIPAMVDSSVQQMAEYCAEHFTLDYYIGAMFYNWAENPNKTMMRELPGCVTIVV